MAMRLSKSMPESNKHHYSLKTTIRQKEFLMHLPDILLTASKIE